MATTQRTHYTNITKECIWDSFDNPTSSGDPDVFINFRIKERSVAAVRSYGGHLVVTDESVCGPVEKVYRIEFGDMIFYRKLTDCVKDILRKAYLLYSSTNYNISSCKSLCKELVDYAHNVALQCILTRLKSRLARLDIIADVEVEKITISDNYASVDEVFARVQSESMADNNQKVRFAASKVSINMLERKKYEKGEQLEACIVCMDDFLMGEEIIVMP
ncbi:hypothetical protein FRX31_027473, partial [Thalictrum thalictroides]